MKCSECQQSYYSEEKSHAYFGLCDLCGDKKLKSAVRERPFGNHDLNFAQIASWAVMGSKPVKYRKAWRAG